MQQLDLISPFQLYFNPTLIVKHFHVSIFFVPTFHSKCYISLEIHQMLISLYFLDIFNLISFVNVFQVWRLITTFLYFGTFGFNFFFNMVFTYRYCKMLEEGSFRNRTADFVVMFLFGGICMIVSFFLIFEYLLEGSVIRRVGKRIYCRRWTWEPQISTNSYYICWERSVGLLWNVI